MNKVLSRDSLPDSRKWKPEDILAESEIERYFSDVMAGITEISAFKDNLTPANTLECLLTLSKISYKLTKLYVYLNLKSDEDKSVTRYQELCEKVSMLASDFSEACSFIRPTVAKFPAEKKKKMRDSESFEYFSMDLDGIIRDKKRLLGRKEEALLSMVGTFSDDFRTIFGMFDNVDIKMGEIELNGTKVPLTHGTYSVALQNPDKNVRKQAYESMFDAYISNINTIAANYAGNVKRDYFYAKVRKHPTCLAKALYA